MYCLRIGTAVPSPPRSTTTDPRQRRHGATYKCLTQDYHRSNKQNNIQNIQHEYEHTQTYKSNIQTNNTASQRCLIRTVPLRHGWAGGRRKWCGRWHCCFHRKCKALARRPVRSLAASNGCRAGRLRRQVQRPLEGYIHVPTDYCGTAYRSRR